MSTAPEGPTANLVVTFDPNPTPHFDYGRWSYRVYVTETNGVGVHIYGWVREGFSAAGAPYIEDVRTEVDFINEFDRCEGGFDDPFIVWIDNYMPPGSTWCSDRILEEGRNNGWQTFTFYGVDDFGNEVSATGRQDLL